MAPAVIVPSTIAIGVQDENCVSPSQLSKFHDAAVQTDFDGEKLPDGFVPYTQHRFHDLVMHICVFCVSAMTSDAFPVESPGFISVTLSLVSTMAWFLCFFCCLESVAGGSKLQK